MSLNLDAAGNTYGPFHLEYSTRDVMLYALAVGATEDELPFVYERYGPQVIPSFAVVPSFKAATAILEDVGVEGKPIVHGEQQLRLFRPIPPAGRFTTELRLNGIYDKGSGAVLDMTCYTKVADQPLCENHVSFFVVGDGGFGGGFQQ